MDISTLYYFSEVVKDMNITKTAGRLYMSQQTLSNHILRLEEYYGVKLLERKPSLSLTYAGELVLNFANELYREEKNLMDKLTDIKQQEKGVIFFGASTLRMSSCLPNILPKFSENYPKVEVRITDTNSKMLEQYVAKGDIDLAIAISIDNPSISKIRLMSDQVYLCIADSLLEKYYKDDIKELKLKSYKGADLKNFSKLPFCMLDNYLGQNIWKCFEEAGFVPQIYTTSSYLQIGTSIGFQGVAACFATRTSLLNLKGNIPKNINVFPLNYNSKHFMQEIFLIHRKDRYFTAYMLNFINLIKEYFNNIEQLSIKQLIDSNY